MPRKAPTRRAAKLKTRAGRPAKPVKKLARFGGPPDSNCCRRSAPGRAGGGEVAADEALSAADRTGRLAGALDRFFRHYARLTRLTQRQNPPASPEMPWARPVLLLTIARPDAVARRSRETADIPHWPRPSGGG